ncbi:hypothetical protein F2Q68_00015884 [Brassica cretica]|uniref:Uncharacterized protein n=1 Tax=Brassica cretica TaxID=69181 RepID=A0A8S9HST5_BRACR|nr:hypothetical protein F2Q68_00015884 [Brassica cretica]
MDLRNGNNDDVGEPQGHYCLLPSPPQSRYHESSDVFKSYNGFVTSSTTKLLYLVHLPVTRTNSKHRERVKEIERERGASVVTSGGGGDYGEDETGEDGSEKRQQ